MHTFKYDNRDQYGRGNIWNRETQPNGAYIDTGLCYPGDWMAGIAYKAHHLDSGRLVSAKVFHSCRGFDV